MSNPKPDPNDLATQLLGNPDGLVLHWTLTARIESIDDTTTVSIITDDRMDVITQLGLARAATISAEDRFNGYTEPDPDDDDE